MNYKVINASECCIKFDGNICLLHRSKLNTHYPDYFCFPGGSIDNNEDPLIAAKREVFEETGIKLDKELLKLKVIEYNFHDDDKELWIIYTFNTVLEYLPQFSISNEGKPNFFNSKEIINFPLIPQTKNYLSHAISNSNKVMLINQHFIGDKITKIVSTTFI
jgi:8-oxo-dGTP pyrophosphatase MutT (NUDIX family)